MRTIEGLGALFDRMPVALYRSAPNGRLLAANTALATLLGYESADEILAAVSNVREIYASPELRLKWIEEIEHDGIVYDFDVELRRADGSTVWVEDTARVVKGDDGSIFLAPVRRRLALALITSQNVPL